LDNQVSGFIDFFFSCTDTVVYDLATFVNAWFFQDNKFLENEYLNFLKSYQNNFELKNDEKNELNFYLKVSAIRFFLTRLYDLHFNIEGDVKHKNPIEFFEIFKFHEKNKQSSDCFVFDSYRTLFYVEWIFSIGIAGINFFTNLFFFNFSFSIFKQEINLFYIKKNRVY